MALYVIIGLVLASFVIAFFSARTWHWGHVIVVVGISLATLGFIILAAEVLRINKVYRTAINDKTKQLDTLVARNDALENGTDKPEIISQLQSESEPAIAGVENAESIPSLDQLDHEILLATRLRGRVWRNVAPAGIDANGVKVNIQAPVPAGLNKDTVVYLFEQGPAQPAAADGTPRGPQYLGEFRVSDATGQQANLVPVNTLDEFEQKRLIGSRGPWAIYETMPPDRHEIFAGMTEEQLKQKLPAKSVEEYLRHGKEATPDDDPLRQVGYDADGKRLPPEQIDTAAKKLYERRLRDYASEFDELMQRRVANLVSIDEVKADIARLEAAIVSAKELQSFRQGEVQKLGGDLAGIKKERQAIDKHLAQLQQQLDRAKQLLAELLRKNSEMARRLAGQDSTTRSTMPAAPQAATALAAGVTK